ncbi:hypothetical protein J6590_093929 [Homalodisca vitripennis]|nr:hypothetical protein J6590_093929 [Homalodisca vitripennis]
MAKSLGKSMLQHALLMRAVVVDTTNMQLSQLAKQSAVSAGGQRNWNETSRESCMSICHCSTAPLSGIGLINDTRRQDVEFSMLYSSTRGHWTHE